MRSMRAWIPAVLVGAALAFGVCSGTAGAAEPRRVGAAAGKSHGFGPVGISSRCASHIAHGYAQDTVGLHGNAISFTPSV